MKSITLIGNVGKDPEMKTSQKGESIASFSVAITDGFGDNQKTEWYNCTAFGKSAENIEKFVKKGSKVAIIGTPKIEEYEDKNGVKQRAFKVIVGQIEFLTSKEQVYKEISAQLDEISVLKKTADYEAPADTDNLPF